MIKSLKWLYELGYNKAQNEVFVILENERELHYSQAQIKSLQETVEEDNTLYRDRTVSPSDHEQRAKEVEHILYRLDPERYPDFNRFMELLR